MSPLNDATPLLPFPDQARAAAAKEGFLFLPGLLPEEPIRDARREILAVCERHGFLAEGSDPADALARPGVRCREGDAEYMAAYDDIQRLETFHALAHEPALLQVLETLLGEAVLVHPRNIARVMFPQNNEFMTPAHQDFVHIQGTADTWTAWIPLGDCPRDLGGLEVLAGSHRCGVLPVRAAYGAGGLGVETDQLGLEWRGTDFRCGDVLLFHSHLVHRGSPNLTSDQIRLSVDFRYQGASQPVTEFSLQPHFNRLTWNQIYKGWRRPELQFYWREMELQHAEHTREFHETARREARKAV